MSRCKPGDVAFFRKGVPENMNKFVQVLGPCNNPGLQRLIAWGDDGVWWLVECSSPIIHPCGHAHGTAVDGKFRDFVPDDHLTPLRDQPGEDEIVTRVGKPKVREKEPELT